MDSSNQPSEPVDAESEAWNEAYFKTLRDLQNPIIITQQVKRNPAR